MTTIPQVARALRQILTTTAAAAGRATRCVQCPSPLHGATVRQTWGGRGKPQAPLAALPHTAAAWGVALRPQALEPRLPASAAPGRPQRLWTASARGLTAAPSARPLLEWLPAVSGHESAPSIVPAVFAAPGHGGGGRPSSSPSAARTRQARGERGTGRLAVQRPEGRASARAACLPGPRPAGALRRAALGSGRREACAALAQPQGVGRSRRPRPTAVDEATGDRRELRARWESQATDTSALAVARGERQRRAARLGAVRGPQDGPETRWRRVRPAARAPGRQGRATRLALAAWTICVTQVLAARVPGRAA